MDKESVKVRISELVAKYQKASQSGQLKKYSEEDTKKDFILPLFQSLGWDIFERREVSAEEHIESAGRVDYGFFLDGRIKFYLEAKPFRADLHKPEFASQAIRYSWNKGATWAVLTDFESIKVFNTQDIEKSLAGKLFFEISCNQFLERFDQLWLLSKEAFKENLIDVEAEKVGKKYQRVPVSNLLYKDLSKCREILTKALAQWNERVDKSLLDEGVQKLLDRLIFIRVAEDRGVESQTLIPLLRQWESRGDRNKVPLYKSMVAKFRELDAIYNSNLFTEHPFENWEEYSGATEEVIKILYGKAGYYEYDFKAMPADVLGSVYENYLGHKLLQSKKGIALDKDSKKRKEHGIYYTPAFIVDYIVKNALQPVLDKCESIDDLKKIKVLDPACGSGSFLIQALELIHEKYKQFGNPGGILTKIQILTNNIYGVDLDPQAVEIARLNLLINSLDSRMKMPLLAENIKNGNSLISGTDKELEKYFGKNFRDKKPFNWEEEFPDVFKQGGFDVIIGNPPYLSIERGLLDDLNYFRDKFTTLEKIFDIFGLFIEQSLKLIRSDGRVGFIVPSIFLMNDSFKKLREKLLTETVVSSINHYKDGVFLEAIVPTSIIIFKKIKDVEDDYDVNVNVFEKNQLIKSKLIKASFFKKDKLLRFNIAVDDEFLKLKSRLLKATIPLAQTLLIQEALKTGDDKKFISNKPFSGVNNKVLLKGSDINRYTVLSEHYIDYDKDALKRPGKEEVFNSPEKLYIRRIGNRIIATLDNKQRYAVHTLYTGILINKDFDYYFLLGLLNSKLFTYLYRKLFPFKGDIFPEIRIGSLGELPVKTSNANKGVTISLVKKMVNLKKESLSFEENSDKWQKIKEEITQTDRKIDEEVYKLYGLTPEEIKIVENQT